jgi:hypothetical protein
MEEPYRLDKVSLGVRLWHGRYEDLVYTWLRWCDMDGKLIPTGAESTRQERQRADRLAEQVRRLGGEPEV